MVDAAPGDDPARLMGIAIRRGTAQDAPALARLRWQWDQRRGTVDQSRFVEFFTAWVVDHLSTHLPFVAEVDGRLAGMAWLMLADRVPSPSNLRGVDGRRPPTPASVEAQRRAPRRFGDVQSVYVVPELRNRGVGAALMDAVIAEARARELEFVTVHSSERAVLMYERAGFRAGRNWLEFRD